MSDERFDPYDDSIPVAMRMGMQRLLEPRPLFDPDERPAPDPEGMTPDVGDAPVVQMSKRRKSDPATGSKRPFGVARQPGQESPSEPGRDRRELASIACEIVGLVLFSAGFWALHLWLGLIVTGICLVLFGVATSNQFSRPRD